MLHDLVPWSPHVAEVLREQVERPATAVRAYPIDSDPDWSAALIPDVLWLPEWWFRMRYGITAWPRWVWFRFVGHPARLALSAGRAVMTRLPPPKNRQLLLFIDANAIDAPSRGILADGGDGERLSIGGGDNRKGG